MTHVSLSDCLIRILFYLFFRFRRTTKEMAKTSNAAATLLSGPTIVSAIVSLWNFVFVPHTNLFNSGENQLPSPRFEVSTNAQKYVKQHQTLNSLFGILFKRGVIVQMSRRRTAVTIISHNAAYPKSLIYGVDL